ncbi:urease accessory protein UreF [Pararhodonellum marinum]|uniref:urease accessory protein UreF n=1 Tax=Pararhodonellum marinum TaxID=2755358 RepID=UPI00188E0561|nr:urease accessory protein UreF [Pararhodonellum marinum]
MNHFLGKMLHLCDPTLPIGGFSHSNGLETYVQLGIVKDETTAAAFVKSMVENNLLYNDASFVKLAFEAAQQHDVEELIVLDHECSALKAPVEIKEASKKLGNRLFKIFDRQASSDLIDAYQLEIKNKGADGQYAIVYGIYAHLFQIPLYEAIYSFCYSATVNLITNAVKMVPLGQLSGQDLLFQMEEILIKTTEKVISLDRELVGICNIGFDIRCMQHEKLYSRLYMS